MNRFKLKLPLAPENRIVRWANAISAFYGHPLYLVGSQLYEKKKPSDVDIVCPIPDAEFAIRYGDVEQWQDEGISGLYSELRWDWADDCYKRSMAGTSDTKMVIDFKVQPMSHWLGYSGIHTAFPPVRLDTRPE